MLEEIINIIIAISFIIAWVDYVPTIPQTYKITSKLDFKPFNCGYCLSFWIGIILAICLKNTIYLVTPIIYLLIKKQI